MAINGKPSVPNITGSVGMSSATYLAGVGLTGSPIWPIAGSQFSPIMGSSNKIPHTCKCCGRQMGLPRGDRGLCDGCDEDIPNHIPEQQYLTYMKELWRIK